MHCPKISLPRLLVPIGLFLTCRCASAQDSASVRQVRESLVLNRFAEAAKLLPVATASAVTDQEKDVAKILGAEILMGSGKQKEADALLGSVPDDGPTVVSEKLRLKAWWLARQGKRDEALDSYGQLLKEYPRNLLDVDLLNAAPIPGSNDFVRAASSVVGPSPLVAWAKSFSLHWQQDAREGLRLMSEAEAGVKEPLLSAARDRKLIFARGNDEDPDRIEVAKQIASQIINAAVIDPRPAITTMAVMLRTRPHPDGMGDWLTGLADASPKAAVAANIKLEAVKEYVQTGSEDKAAAVVAAWGRTAGPADDVPLKQARDFVAQNIWHIEGSLPGEWLKTGQQWKVVALSPSLSAESGPVPVTSSALAGPDGRFKVGVTGKQLDALVAYAETREMPVMHRLLEDVASKGQPVEHYPEDFTPWPAAPVIPAVTVAHGVTTIPLVEYFGRDWPAQLIEVEVTAAANADPKLLRVTDEAGNDLPAQFLGRREGYARIGVWRGLRANEHTSLNISFDAQRPNSVPPGFGQRVTSTKDGDLYQVVDTGPAQFRVLSPGRYENLAPPAAADYAFVQALRGRDGKWRGARSWQGEFPPVSVKVEKVLDGPIRTAFRDTYKFANGASRVVTVSFDAGEPVVMFDEEGEGQKPGEFCFELASTEGFDTIFDAGRPYRYTEPLVKRNPRMYYYLKDYPYYTGGGTNVLFAGVLAKNGPAQDAVAGFVVHPGDWFDPSFTMAFRPLNDQPDLPWAFPARYTGSTNSAIQGQVEADGDFPMRIPLTPGTRRWGLAVSDREKTPLTDAKAIWQLQDIVHHYNRGDLSRYLKMTLQWESRPAPPHSLRADVRQGILQLRADGNKGLFLDSRHQMESGWQYLTFLRRMLIGVQDNDPALIMAGWRLARASLHRQATWSSSYETDPSGDINSVSARDFNYSMLSYLVADELGLVDPATRSAVQHDAALVAYRLWSPDFINWRMNGGQPNFEADRLLQLAAFTAAFPEHPDAPAMSEHVARQTAEMLRQWTILDGGKWAENIGNYYLHSFGIVSRISRYLTYWDRLKELSDSPAYEPFCRFAINMASAPQPADTAWLKKDAIAGPQRWVRWIPGVGDHGGEGGHPIEPEFVLLSQTLAGLKPELSADLRELWLEGGSYIGNGMFSESAAEFRLFGRSAYEPAPPLKLEKRRIHGWGMVMRDQVGTPREFNLTFHAGTQAYRDDGFGGAILLAAEGAPLSLDGGDLGAIEGHSTIALDVRPGAFGGVPRGTISRWIDGGSIQYARGDLSQDGGPTAVREVVYARPYVLVRDFQDTRFPGVFTFVTPAKSVEQKEAGVLCHGKLGVDLWISELAEKQPETTAVSFSYANAREKGGFSWRQYSVRVPFGKTGMTLLYPVKAGGDALKVQKSGPNAWSIKGPGINDVLFSGDADLTAEGGVHVAFKGSLGLWRSGPGASWSFSMFEGSEAVIDGRSVRSTEPLTVTFDGKGYVETRGSVEVLTKG